jgi:hypothetical protein
MVPVRLRVVVSVEAEFLDPAEASGAIGAALAEAIGRLRETGAVSPRREIITLLGARRQRPRREPSARHREVS